MAHYLNMGNPYHLRLDTINRVVKERAGNYALGHYRKSEGRNKFYVHYNGRSFTNLREEIKQQGLYNFVNKNKEPIYTYFKFKYMSNPKSVFQKECKDYHEHGKANQIHPARPKGTDWTCPVKGCRYHKLS